MKLSTSSGTFLTVGIVLPVLFLSEAQAATGYSYTTLDHPNALGSFLYGINDNRQLVGGFDDATGTHGFIYNGGAYTTLDDPNGLAGRYAVTFAHSINNQGQVAGEYGDAGGLGHGFVYDNGQYTTLDDPNTPDGETFAYGINDSGQVVGYYNLGFGGLHGFFYGGGAYNTLDNPHAVVKDGFGTNAYGINNLGQVVGTFSDAAGTHGFIDIGGNFTALDAPGAVGSTYAYGINDNGDVAGYFLDAAGVHHGFVYSGGTYTILDNPKAAGGSFGTAAYGINNHGEVAGYYEDAHGVHGFVATSNVVPFSAFGLSHLYLDPSAGALSVLSSFTLGKSSNGISTNDPVTLTIGNVSFSIPPGSFTKDALGTYTFFGSVQNVYLESTVWPLGGNNFKFELSAFGANLSALASPATVKLVVGNNQGATSTNVNFVK